MEKETESGRPKKDKTPKHPHLAERRSGGVFAFRREIQL